MGLGFLHQDTLLPPPHPLPPIPLNVVALLDQNSAKTLQDTKTLRIVLELQDIKHQIRKKKSKQATMKMDTEDTNHY